jgi:hypothetical protein
MKAEDMDDITNNFSHPMMRIDGFDKCCVGIVERYGMDTIFCYDQEMIIKELMVQGMNEDEAWEYFDFNILNAWMGDGTPCFINPEGKL